MRIERRIVQTTAVILFAAVGVALPAAGARDRLAAPPLLAPLADAYVSSKQPRKNFGTASSLRVGGSQGARAYLGFMTRKLSGLLGRATLSVYVTAGSSAGFKVVATDGRAWKERQVTYRNAPGLGAAGPVSGSVRSRRWATIDVTPLARPGRYVTFALVGLDKKEIRVASRESAGHRPRLVVSLGAEQPSLPVRAAFYYPWYPEAWKQKGISPFTRYTPSLGFYDSTRTDVVRKHIEAMLYGRIQVGLTSWWGRGTRTDERTPKLLAVTRAMGSAFRWALYYEPEGQGAPSADQLRADLTYIHERYGRDPSYLRLGERFVIFAYGDPADDCGVTDRWKLANTVNAYVVLKVFPGYRACKSQPDGWHQYAPASPEDGQLPASFAISPGFNLRTDSGPRLERSLARWAANIRAMIASKARFQLVTTFNEWGEGTAVEGAREWETASGYGVYLDVLRRHGREAQAPPPPPPPPPTSGDPVIAAVGDIACDPATAAFNGGNGTARNCRQKATSDLVVNAGLAAVLTLGDTQYEDNAYEKFLVSYDPSWGRVKSITHPAIGNHEYLTKDAVGYFRYFGAAAGDPSKGYYSFNLGSWHLIAINSQCSHVGGCHPSSPQVAWLKSDLAAHKNRCVLAYWHEPRFSSGQHGNHPHMSTIWNELVTGGADVVLAGHNHVYERFEPIGITPQSSDKSQHPNLDPNGIRQFVVGTGGKNVTKFTKPPLTGEIVRNDETYGVLKLTLHAGSYDWLFVPEAGKTFTDVGSGQCH